MMFIPIHLSLLSNNSKCLVQAAACSQKDNIPSVIHETSHPAQYPTVHQPLIGSHHQLCPHPFNVSQTSNFSKSSHYNFELAFVSQNILLHTLFFPCIPNAQLKPCKTSCNIIALRLTSSVIQCNVWQKTINVSEKRVAQMVQGVSVQRASEILINLLTTYLNPFINTLCCS